MPYYKHFESLEEFCKQDFTSATNKRTCEYNLGTGGASGNEWSDKATSYGSGYEWLGGTRTPSVAAKRVTAGWQEGAQRVRDNLESLETPKPMHVKRQIVRSDQGDEFDIHSVYRGHLDTAWTSRKRRNARGPFIIRIIAQTNLLSDFSGEQMFWRGAAAVKAVELLSEAGYSVEVVGVLASSTVRGNAGTFAQSFPLKHSGAPLDVAQLAGVLCNAGFHRLFGFRAYAAACTGVHSIGDASSDTSGAVIESLDLKADGIPTFRVPYAIRNKAQAEKFIRDLILELEGNREEDAA